MPKPISGMPALGYLTRYSGTDATMGLAFAVTGAFQPFFGSMLVYVKRPEQGKMKDVAFIKDPDGYWIEIVEPARLKGLGR